MGLKPMHPGELLREELLPALKRDKSEIARLLGVSRQTLYDTLGERQPVSSLWRYGLASSAAMAPIPGSISTARAVGHQQCAAVLAHEFGRHCSPRI